MTTPADAPRWLYEGEQELLQQVVVAEADLSGASLLPAWTRADVVAHLIGNAQALNNLVTWAATGKPTPMYASRQARSEQITEYARNSPEWLRSELAVASAHLSRAFTALSAEQRQVIIKTARGEERPASVVAWMRARESAVHLVDLDIGFGFGDLPADVLDAICAERLESLADAPDLPAMVVRPHDRDAVWHIGGSRPEQGEAGASDGHPVTIDASLADIVAWLTGRPPAAGRHRDDWPELPDWL